MSVHDTRIFARMAAGGVQYVIYQMDLNAKEDLAMVLPIPVNPIEGRDTMKFINFEAYPTFFDDMRKPFDEDAPRAAADPFADLTLDSKPKLQVHRVGSYDASFVPDPSQFNRLDERFRLPAKTFETYKEYEHYGFAVFKLRAGDARVHPMAFAFRSGEPGMLFFPTVHVHDGEMHERESFDHELYLQGGFPGAMTRLGDDNQRAQTWTESSKIPTRFMKLHKTKGLVLPDKHVFRLTLRGEFLNRDVFVKVA
ncbi:MAG: hypothetical protein AAF585_19765 [Verrucomicrobiota bacterium]